MKRIKFAERLLVALTIFYITYNSIFGWNMTSQSVAETNCDNIWSFGFTIVCIAYLLPLMKVYEKFIKDWEAKNKK